MRYDIRSRRYRATGVIDGRFQGKRECESTARAETIVFV